MTNPEMQNALQLPRAFRNARLILCCDAPRQTLRTSLKT
jgi:hypothetical protein